LDAGGLPEGDEGHDGGEAVLHRRLHAGFQCVVAGARFTT
jgi:hypothetical protein